ncbi:MAG: carbon-nitrogen hydrolase family protein [Anaerolineae bacterium]|nr:carbon-nitrogen hydrolase family protein [Anaerolineae bacterium]
MSRKLKIAAIQMEATPAPTADRLTRAADLVTEAVTSGAELVVLPECFNTGYAYIESNYAASEPMDGQTVTWMKTQAAQHKIHLVGTLMLRDGDEVYNSALLFAPDGRLWRYDKRYPFNWERAYFREGHQPTVADTDLGKFGMMICWDSAHANLWEEYAGKVDAVIIPSCPPRVNDAHLVFPDGKRVQNWVNASHFADQDIHDQAAWLKVPAVHSSGGGQFRSPMPLPFISVMGLLLARPAEWGYIPKAASAQLETDYGQHTQIINKDGAVVGRVTESGDGFTLAEVELADPIPEPDSPQPKMRTPNIAYFLADTFAPFLLKFVYRRGLKRHLAR